ncbi:MAG: tetratricopeptide repeat protein, partial [Raineya sp.]
AGFSLAVLLYEQNKFQEAEPLFLNAKNILEKVYGKKHPDRLMACQYLINLYQKQNKTALAEMLSKEIAEDIK